MLASTMSTTETVLTSSEHQRTLAEAVVVVGVPGAEAGAVRCQAALRSGRATVALQQEP